MTAVMIAADWRPVVKNSLQGFFTLKMPSGLILCECMLHESNGKRWIGMPAKPQTHKDGTPVLSPRSGKPAWSPLVKIEDKQKHKVFQAAALAAIEKLLGKGSAP